VTIRGDISSQFTTGLLVALGARGKPAAVSIEGELTSKPYVELTLAAMAQFGVAVAREGWQRFVLDAGEGYRSPGVVRVEGDASTASYFLAAGALGGGTGARRGRGTREHAGRRPLRARPRSHGRAHHLGRRLDRERRPPRRSKPSTST
jgi:3-phosphoshikimate 1-carboxyvinyltransferase